MTSSPPIKWRSRVRLVDEVAAVLRDRIEAGAYGPGERLRQQRLSDDLGVSRTPLREALRMLEREGLVRTDPRQGVRVVPGDHATLLKAYQVREVIDGLAARLAAANIDDDAVSRLRAIIAEQQSLIRPWRPDGYTKSNIQFHSTILALTENEFVESQMPILRMTARVFTPVSLVDRKAAETAIVQHGDILDAIARGDGAAAESAARLHIQTTIRRLSQNSAPPE